MAYKFKQQESIPEGARRIATEQVEKAIAECDWPLDQHQEAIHQVRKRCKKLRGLLRLVQPQMPKIYRKENGWYRDIARNLSLARDSQSVVEALSDLLEQNRDLAKDDSVILVQQHLTTKNIAESTPDQQASILLSETKKQLIKGLKRIPEWSGQDSSLELLAVGLVKSYGRSRKLNCKERPQSVGELHEWRKGAQAHWYDMSLVADIWQEPLGARQREAQKLSDYLGRHRDLSLLATNLPAIEQDHHALELGPLIAVLKDQQQELLQKAEVLGQRLFAEDQQAFGKRFKKYLAIWLKNQPQKATASTPSLLK